MKSNQIIFGLLLVAVLFVGCSQSAEILQLSEHHITIEYGDAVHFEKYLSNSGYSNFTVKGFNALKVGTQTVTLSAQYDSVRFRGDMDVQIIDTNAPRIKKKTKNTLEIEEGDELDLKVHFEARDVIDGELDIKVHTDIKTLSPGSHRIKISATDKNGLVSSEMVDLTVLTKTPDPKPEEKPIPNSPNNQQPSEPNPIEPSEHQPSKPEAVPENPEVPSVPEIPDFPDEPQPSLSPEKPQNLRFMFTDGYDFNTSASACSEYLSQIQSQGYGGGCYPLKDGNGIYIGYEAIVK